MNTDSRGSASRVRRAFLGIGVVVALAAYALPLYAPPPGMAPVPPAPDASLIERLFPGVPGWWVVVRLLCLFFAAVLAATFSGSAFPPVQALAPEGRVADVPVRVLWLALAVAALQVIVGFGVAAFGRHMQLAYIAWFAAPSVIVLVASRYRRAPRQRSSSSARVAVAAIVALWLLLNLWLSWRSPQLAHAVDAWGSLRQLRAAGAPASNLLLPGVRPGLSPVYSIFQGSVSASLTGLSIGWIQGVHLGWLAVSAAMLALLAGRVLTPVAAPLTAAAFLFSPYVLTMPLTAVPLFLGPLAVVVSLRLLLAVHGRRSVAAFLALAGCAAVAIWIPPIALVVAVTGALALGSALRSPRLPTVAIVAAACTVAAGVLPGAETFARLPGIARAYARGNAVWVGDEMSAFGQVSPLRSEYMVEVGAPGRLDIPVAAVLAPFAVPRTGMRLVGDTLFDPLTACLAAIGIALCLGALRTSVAARVTLLLLATAIVPAFTSTADRVSFIRLLALPAPMALLAAIGFTALQRRFAAANAASLAALATLVIAGSGLFLFVTVTPRLIAAPWGGIVVQALEGNVPHGGALALDHRDPNGFPAWYLNAVLSEIPSRPVAVRPYTGPLVLQATPEDAAPAAELMLWSPGVEEDEGVSAAVCAQWPDAALYTLVDAAGISRVYAARPQGRGWIPRLPEAQWSVAACGTVLPTEATWAAEVIDQARRASAGGRRAEALSVLRAAARRNYCQTDLFLTLAQTLLDGAPNEAEVAEAVDWARRATQADRSQDPRSLALLKAAQAASQQYEEQRQTK